MILGYLLFAIVAAAISSVFALLSGASVLLALGIYTLVGTLTLIVVPLTAILLGASYYRDEGMAPTKRQPGPRNRDLGAPSIDHI